MLVAWVPFLVSFLELLEAKNVGPDEGWRSNAHNRVLVEELVQEGNLTNLVQKNVGMPFPLSKAEVFKLIPKQNSQVSD